MSARFADPAPPPLSRLRWEALSGIEIPKLLVRSPWLARAPRGEAVVAVLPGYGADDTSTLPLRWFLGRLGHDVHGWRLGRNRGDVPALIPVVVRGVRELAERHGEPVHLVGQSLGGVLARETARDHPDLIAQVITLGTPVVGGPAHTRVGAGTDAAGLARIDAAIQRRNRIPIRVPLTIVYSRRDGIVNWRACVDEEHPHAEHVEVSSSHLGMGIDPNVWELVARGLARQGS
jgi:pimeloyl-ACP methyl ester carboxylesterase